MGDFVSIVRLSYIRRRFIRVFFLRIESQKCGGIPNSVQHHQPPQSTMKQKGRSRRRTFDQSRNGTEKREVEDQPNRPSFLLCFRSLCFVLAIRQKEGSNSVLSDRQKKSGTKSIEKKKKEN